jgi:putative acetyltransferase
VGSALLNEVGNSARQNKLNKLFAEVSITARPFFEKKGFIVKKQQSVVVREVELTNFVMEKLLSS